MICNNISPWKYCSSEKKLIRKLKKFSGKTWDCKDVEGNQLDVERRSSIRQIKFRIRSRLDEAQKNNFDNQLRCAYCGSVMGVTSSPEIEHIANKARYPQFMFYPVNLVLACHLCNFPEKKGQKDVISVYNCNYKLCEFTIVHPILDDRTQFIKTLVNDSDETLILTSDKPKGIKTIEMFKLNEECYLICRYNEYLMRRIRSSNHKHVILECLEYV